MGLEGEWQPLQGDGEQGGKEGGSTAVRKESLEDNPMVAGALGAPVDGKLTLGRPDDPAARAARRPAMPKMLLEVRCWPLLQRPFDALSS